MEEKIVDFLLVNLSNFPDRPIYPYAFVQIGALFRRQALSYKRLDLLGQAPLGLDRVLSEAMNRYRPRLIGFHIRQLDSCDLRDYLSRDDSNTDPFLPLDLTRHAIQVVGSISNTPTIVGGIGFTFQPEACYQYLNPTYGNIGDVDSLAMNFERVALGQDLSAVPNLIYRDEGGQLCKNEVRRYPCNDDVEYDEETISDLRSFYTDIAKVEIQTPHVAIEVARGCPYACYFCGEPVAKGRTVRWRPIETIKREIQRLVDKGFRKFWFVCSELNPKGDLHFLGLSSMMAELAMDTAPLEWSGYILPYVDPLHLRMLESSGYKLANNEVLSFDAANFRSAKVPYKRHHAQRFLQYQVSALPPGEKRKITLFIGNAKTDPGTIGRTARYMIDEGLLDKIDICSVVYGSRVYNNVESTGWGGGETFEFDGTELRRTDKGAIDGSRPTFLVPKAVADELISIDEVDRFYRFCGKYLFSREYAQSLDWYSFYEEQREHDASAPCSKGAAQAKLVTQAVQNEIVQAIGVSLPGNLDLLGENVDLYNSIYRFVLRSPTSCDLSAVRLELSSDAVLCLDWLIASRGIDLALRYMPILSVELAEI